MPQNISSDILTQNGRLEAIGNVVVPIVSLLSIISNSFALTIIIKCRKTPFQIRYLSISFLVCFIIFETSLSGHTLAFQVFSDAQYWPIFNSRIIFSSVLAANLWGSICAVSLERAVALTMPFHYIKYITKFKLKFAIATLWCLSLAIPLTTFLITFLTECSKSLNFNYLMHCDIYAIFKPMRMYLTGQLTMYAMIILVSSIQILRIMRHHNCQMNSVNLDQKKNDDASKPLKYFRSTRIILMVIFAFIALQSPPLLFHLIAFDHIPQIKTARWRLILQYLDYAGHTANTYATLYIYIWKRSECRMHFYFILSRLNSRYLETANLLRLKVYAIVLNENNTTQCSRPTTEKYLGEIKPTETPPEIYLEVTTPTETSFK